ncbi:hypothetical protein D3C84_554170 [compost metagenome]
MWLCNAIKVLSYPESQHELHSFQVWNLIELLLFLHHQRDWQLQNSCSFQMLHETLFFRFREEVQQSIRNRRYYKIDKYNQEFFFLKVIHYSQYLPEL